MDQYYGTRQSPSGYLDDAHKDVERDGLEWR